jgi:hypothetical protein
MTKTQTTEIITSYPVDEGYEAAHQGIPIHKNPYKSPNTPKTDDVKSEAWLRGYSNYMSIYHPV